MHAPHPSRRCEALLDSYQRLQLLAKAHELLYSNPSGTQTVRVPQPLQTLGDALQQSFANTSTRVPLEIMSDSITLPVEIAIPIALLVNEAVTNAYKHAFPNGSSGKITVHLRTTPENGLLLRIADTGTGVHLNTGEGGMGLKLMCLFAAQLHGTLTLGEQPITGGTVVALTIALGAR
jgi:two-component sensor histidine kinase